MSDAVRWYHVEASFRRLHIFAGFAGVALGLFFALVPPFTAPDLRTPAAVLCFGLFGAFWASLGLWCFWFASRVGRYALGLSELGIHPPDPEAPVVPWSELRSLRERRFAHRLDLLGHDRQLLARLEYQVEGFDEAAAILCSHLPREQDQAPRDEFRARHSLAARAAPPLITAGFTGLTLWLIALNGPSFWLILMLLFWPLIFWLDERNHLRGVWLRTEELIVRWGWKEQHFSFTDIETVMLALRSLGKGRSVLDVRLVMRDGNYWYIRPTRIDAVELFLAVETAWRTACPNPEEGPQPASGANMDRS